MLVILDFFFFLCCDYYKYDYYKYDYYGFDNYIRNNRVDYGKTKK